MFGQSNTPFGSSAGGGGFGQQATNTAPAFGSPAPAPGGLFGGAAPAAPFGAAAPAPSAFGGATTTPAFGAPQATAGAFGQPQQAPGAPGAGLFGAPSAPPQAPGGFGGGTAFGAAPAAPAPGGAFGATTTAFGAAPAAPFGANPAGGFGGSTTTGAFGASTAPAQGGGLFGSTAPAPAFGAQAPGAFGAPAAAGGGLFGAAAPAPAGGGLFGQPAAAPAFGSSPSSAAPFGSTTTGTTFGAAAPAGGGLFGAPAATSPAPAAPFGAPAPTTTFGAQPAAGAGQGTRGTPYQVTSKHDGTASINIQSITAMQAYENQSFEELRFQDYSQGNKGSTSTPTASGAGGFFGSSPAAPAPGGGLFGAAPAPAPGGGLFGAPAAPAPAPGLFGAAPTPAPGFGSTFNAPAPAPGGGLFGAAPAPAPGGGLFGAAPAPAPGGGLFGAPAAPAPAGGGFGFGAAPAPAPLFGAAPAPAPGAPLAFGGGGGFGGFGTPAPAPGGFGAPPAAPSPGGGLFGQQQPAPALGFGAKPAGTSLFGQQPAPAAPFSFAGAQPAPATGSFFGAQPAAQQPGGLFGAQPPTTPFAGAAPSLFPQNAVIMPPATNEVLAQQLRAVEKATQELKKAEAWQTNSAGKSSNSTPTSVSEAESLLMPNHYRNGLSPLYATSSSSSPTFFQSPQSGAKIRPRGAGFPKTEPVKKSSGTEPVLSRMGRGGAATPGVSSTNGGRASRLAPDSYFRSPTLQLVVKPSSLAKPSSLSKVQFRLDMEAPSPGADGGAAESDSPRFASETITSPPTEYSPTPPTPGSQQQESRATTSPPGRATGLGQSTPESSPAANSYYQQTIGATNESPSRSGQQKPSPSVPKLTKAGYETMPSLAELSAMPDADLATVPNFVVLRPNYGAVRWEGAVDVRGVDLDRAVVIEAKDVSVYSDEEREGTKPEVGTKLNRPAILTYFEVYPKDNPAASVEEKEKFAAKLEKSARRMGAQHCGYDLQSGEWKIRVDHFSRYALVDEDSEDEGSSSATAMEGGTEKQKPSVRFGEIATPQRPSSSILRSRKATPYKTSSRTHFSALDLSESNTEDDSEMMQMDDAVAIQEFSEADIVDAVTASAQAAFNDVFSMLKQQDSKQSSTTAKPRPRTAIVEEDDEELVYEDESDDLDEIYPPTKEELLEARKKKGISSILATQARVGKAGIDASLRLGRSFRLAAAPDGSFVMPGLFGGTLQKFYPVFNKDINVCLQGDVLLEAHRARCQKEYAQGSKCPLFRLPQSDSSLEMLHSTLKKFGFVDCGNSDAQVAFSLIACLLETAARGVGSNTLTVHGSSLGEDFSMRQNTAVLRWLKDVCASDVDRDITTALNRNDVPGAIFAAISGGDIEKACNVAADAGRLGLAMVLATDVEGRGDIVRLLVKLDETGDASAVPPDLLRSLNHIAGDSRFEDTPFRQGRSNLDWRRRLALRLLQEPKEDLNQIIQRYEADVKSGAAPFPSPLYSESPSVDKNGVESIHFRIMRAMTNPGSTKLSEIVPTEGFSESIFDVSMAFHFSASLAAAGAPAPTSSDEVESFLKDYEAQLVGQGRWQWAVFAALSLIGDVSEQGKRRKLERAKSLILLHYWEGDAEAEWRREFLEKELMIPSSWFSEACAGRAISVTDYLLNQVEVDPDIARVALEGRFLPYVFFQSPADNEKLMKFIEAAVAADNQDSLAAAIYRFFRLKDRIQQLLEDKDEQEIAQVLPELEKVHHSVESILSSRQRQQAATVGHTRYFVDLPHKRIELSTMLSEAMYHLRQLQLQMTSMRALAASSLHEEPQAQQDSNMLMTMEE